MLVNKNIISQLYQNTEDPIYIKALEYKKNGKIDIEKIDYKNENTFEISGKVEADKTYNTYIDVNLGEIESINCNCPEYYKTYGVCEHSLAMILMFDEFGSDIITSKTNKRKSANEYNSFYQIAKELYKQELNSIDSDIEVELKNKGTIKIEPQIIYDKFSKEMKVEFKIGNKRMYKIKSLAEFYTKMINKEFYKYGDKLEFVHTKEMFEEDSQKILEFLMKYSEIIAVTNSNANANYKYYGKILNDSSIIVGNTAIDELFESLDGKKVVIERDYEKKLVEFINSDPQANFELKKLSDDEYVIVANFDILKSIILKGKKYKYFLTEDKLYRCTKQFENTNLKLIKLFRENFVSQVPLGKKELGQLFSVILPTVENAIKIDENIENEIREYKPEKLRVKVFLDYDKNNYLTADVRLCYGNNEFNPLNEEEEKNFKYSRNMLEETKAMNVLKKTGFMYEVKNKRFILPNEEKIYEFLINDINYYMNKFEVMVTDEFKTKEIVRPKIQNLGIKVENNLLEVDLNKFDIDLKELEEIINKYKIKKKYHRLKNGNFIELQDNKEIEFMDRLLSGTNVSYAELKSGIIRLPVNRTLYLNQLLKNIKGTEITKNKEYKDIISGLEKDELDEIYIPSNIANVLRPYQKTGFRWLKMLDKYKFGGILADDMGLGKTIQIISVILDYIYNTSNSKTSIVVSPSSLVLNWKNEIEKFAPDLKVKVVSGTADERKKIIKSLENYDLIITSYDLLKRDIDIYNELKYEFKYIIADEAQYLKNNNTQNSKTIKHLSAETRFALTGTPIENSLAELWSIFDFVMPGYLFTYKEFKNNYEIPIIKEQDDEIMQKLKMLIEPFILRRTKKEVLTELPEKTITVLNNEMQKEQKNLYLAYLAKVKQELKEVIEENRFEKNQIKILAALTRLRQICCHPGLFVENYTGGSGKLEQCMEIVSDGINAGHKILIFSTYTSMFEIIGKKLQENNIEYFKLTGSTKVNERLDLVEKFNNTDEVKVFLISLKAGGTGLNLIGADMVIHFDPWWNIAAENQATDRAYRIGQKNNVQVYKLITKDSIEEKIYELQKKKEKLTDNILDTQTKFVNKLSRDDILSLFN